MKLGPWSAIFYVASGILVGPLAATGFGPISRVSRSLLVRHVVGAESDDDLSFYRELEEAKKAKLGGHIPEDQVKASASNAESEFLAAMKEARKEFLEAKEKFGSQGAIDMFLNRIRKEEDDEDDDEMDEDLGAHGEFQ